eukprot:10000685-Alexandrium_andersonii.AAC.1
MDGTDKLYASAVARVIVVQAVCDIAGVGRPHPSGRPFAVVAPHPSGRPFTMNTRPYEERG